MKKFFIIIFLGAILFMPMAAMATSCCVCNGWPVGQLTEAQCNAYNAASSWGGTCAMVDRVFAEYEKCEAVSGPTSGNTCCVCPNDRTYKASRDEASCAAHSTYYSSIYGSGCSLEQSSFCVYPDAVFGGSTEVTATDLTEELGLRNIVLGIAIPNLHFSAPPTEVDEDGNVYIPWAAEYIKAVYNFAMVALSILAVVVLIMSGAQIIMSAGGPAKAAAYKRITQAVVGLFIAWGSYVVLYTINPNLTTLNSLKIKYVEPISFAEEAAPNTDVVSPDLSSQIVKKANKGARNDCLAGLPLLTTGIKLKDYGLDGVSPSGKHGAYYVDVNSLMADDLKQVFEEMKNTGYKIKAAGTLRNAIAACSSSGNLHTCGLAIDINPGDNPDCPAYTKQGDGKPSRKVGQYWDVAGDHKITQDEFDRCGRGERITDIPQTVVDIFEKHGFYWGGYGWGEGRSDAMHFEYHKYCYE